MIRNFCLDILNSGPIQRVGPEKRRGAVEDVDVVFMKQALAQIFLKFISSRCALYVAVILGKPEAPPNF